MKPLTIQILRNSVKNKAYIEYKFSDVDYTQTSEEINEEIKQYGAKIKGTIIDMQTSNLLITVYDALQKPESKAKFERMLTTMENFEKLVNFAWKQVK